MHLQAMRLGSVIVLTRPLLLQAMGADLGPATEKDPLDFGIQKLAHVW